ncbi:hypothetical protein [Corynebacterium guangdongense]|uniref:Secreted protein n=1 Tax=Corynebacterium guangdongense TaxID=1783348 RepID=A0ABU1ZWY4_9CORY|nr:hypothetical protein [Corynebacterium guangdongense]MDR7329452.1 hypothetical protein [Corynebacterium guangdongense]WJZ18017.1 hypothetical protein CGUA_07240 [Corynebacterium guangdongense]
MKNMRKGLVAAATALTVSFAGVSVANAQDAPAGEISITTTVDADTNSEAPAADENTDTEPAEDSSLSSMSSDMEPKEIRDWIAVFTAIVGALSTLFAFVNRI